MKAILKRLMGWFDALSRRERIFVMIAAWLAVLFVLDSAFVSPARQRSAVLSKAVAEKQGEVARFEAEMGALRARLAEDPDAVMKRRIAELEGKISVAERKLHSAGSQIVPPDRMAKLLEQLLGRNKRLELVSLRSLEPDVLVREAPAGDAGRGKSGQVKSGLLYRQGMELVLSGGYLDMLDYIAQVEQLPWKIYWEHLDLKVEEHPRVRLVVSVYTLSMDKDWLSI